MADEHAELASVGGQRRGLVRPPGQEGQGRAPGRRQVPPAGVAELRGALHGAAERADGRRVAQLQQGGGAQLVGKGAEVAVAGPLRGVEHFGQHLEPLPAGTGPPQRVVQASSPAASPAGSSAVLAIATASSAAASACAPG